MISSLLRRVVIIFRVAVLFTSAKVFAQTEKVSPGGGNVAASDAKLLKQKAAWLESIGKDAAANLKLPENRAIVDARLGGDYWKTDQARGRALFEQSLKELKSTETELEAERNTALSNYANYSNLTSYLNSLRRQILQIVIKSDANLGFEFFVKSRPQIVSDALAGLPVPVPSGTTAVVTYVGAPPQPNLQQQIIQQENELEQFLTGISLTSDPQRAIDFLNRATPENITYSTYSLLLNLRIKNQAAADKIAADLVQKLSGIDFNKNVNAIPVANQFLMSALAEGAYPNQVQVDRELIRKLANRVADFLISNANNSSNYAYRFGIDTKPTLIKLLPERATEINEKILAPSYPPNITPPLGRVTISNSSRAVLSNGTPEQILSEAEKYPAPFKDTFYLSAAQKIAVAGDVDRAKKILAEHFSGAGLDSTYNNLYSRLSYEARVKGDYDKALEYIEQINAPNRYNELIALATTIQINTPGEKQKARNILVQARRQIPAVITTGDDFSKWSSLASAYVLVEPETGFKMFDVLIKKYDQILAAAAVVDAFQASGFGTMRKNEYLLSENNYRLYFLSVQPGNFAKADFVRTMKILNQIRRPESRLSLELKAFEDNLPNGGGTGFATGISVGGSGSGVVIRSY